MRRLINYSCFLILTNFKKDFSHSIFFFGRNPSNINLEDCIPLDTSAVMAAHAPGMQINPIPLILLYLLYFLWITNYLAFLHHSQSQLIRLLLIRQLILEFLLKNFILLKLIKVLKILYLFIIFFVCRVSSQATKETFARILIALGEISSKFPIMFQPDIKFLFLVLVVYEIIRNYLSLND